MKSNKKYLENNQDGCPHIGRIIGYQLKAKGLTILSVAKKLGIKAIGVKRYTAQYSFQVAILWRLSIAIGVDLFAYLSQALQQAHPELVNSITNETQVAKDQQIAELEMKIKLYKEILGDRLR